MLESRPSWKVFPLAAAFLALLTAALPAAPVEVNTGVRLRAPSYPIVANEAFLWIVPIRVINRVDAGLYSDSMVCVVEDLDPGQTHASRIRRTTSDDLVRAMRTLSRLDSTVVTYTGAAICEKARLTFHLYTHTAEGEQFESTDSCETAPAMVARTFKSEFHGAKGRRVETVLVPEPWPKGKSPGILLVHGDGNHARMIIPLARYLADHGVTVMLVSQPGYGLSDGPPDFAGPATVGGLELALDALRRSPQVDSSRIAVWGIDRGATAAALLAERRRDLSGLILQSGFYDLKTAYRDTEDEPLKQKLEKEAGGRGGWAKRSPLARAAEIRCPVLFLHGDQDPVARSNQAVDFAGKLRVAGQDVDVQLIPAAGHSLPSMVTYPLVMKFLKERLGVEK